MNDNYCYDMNDVDHADFEKMRVRIAKLEAAIKQILWKLNRKENTSSYHHGVKITTPCTWAKIDINDACLKQAKELVDADPLPRDAASISYRQQVRINSERME